MPTQTKINQTYYLPTATVAAMNEHCDKLGIVRSRFVDQSIQKNLEPEETPATGTGTEAHDGVENPE